MSIADIILIILILIGAYRGYQEGFLMSLLSLLAIILGVIGGFKLMGQAMVLLSNKFNVDTSVLPYISFGVIFILIVIGVSLLGKLIHASIDKNFLGRIDQAVGAMLGLFKVAFMCSVIIWIIESLKISMNSHWFDQSWLYPRVALLAPKLSTWIAKLIPALKGVF